MSNRPARLPVPGSLAAALSQAAYRYLPGKLLRWLHRRRAALFEQADLSRSPQDASQHGASGERLAVLLGDSRAAAWTPPHIPGASIVNRGINGESSTQTLARFSRQVAPLSPHVIILQTGVNDLWSSQASQQPLNHTAAQVVDNIQEIIHQSRQIPAQVILATIFPLGHWGIFERWIDWQKVQESIMVVNEMLENISSDRVSILDSAAVLAGSDGLVLPQYSQDVLHLNAAGYAALNPALSMLLTNPE